MEEKILSIIVPTYNMEDYISKCLDSLIVPSIDKLDILVINDGSKDNTSEIAHEYEKKYPKSIRVIDKKNGNYGSCINVGLPLVIGKYVKILDADDTYNTPELENFIKTLSEVNADLVLSDYVRVNTVGREIKRIRYSLPANVELKFNEVSETIEDGIAMHAVSYRRSIFDGLNYHQTEGISYTDEEWIFSPIINVNTVYYFNKIIYRYLLGRDGQTVNRKTARRKINDCLIGIDLMMAFYNSHTNTTNNKYLTRRLRNRIRAQYRKILINFYPHIDMSVLVSFDDNVKSKVPDIYRQAMEAYLPYIKFQYIKYWNRHKNSHYMRQLPFDILRVIREIAHAPAIIKNYFKSRLN